MTPEGEALLRQGLGELGLVVDAALVAGFSSLLALLQEANARTNLTALRSESDIVVKHFVDSASCLRGAHLEGALSVIDLGTGAGFPTLPLALLRPDLRLTAVDSIRKKVAFVERAVQALALPHVRPLVGRAEVLGRQVEERGQHDRVVVRAVAALPVLVELALPLLRVGGALLAQKGPIGDDELEAGRLAAAELGGAVTAVDSFRLPVSGDPRTLIVVTKTAATPDRYPRREGVPAQHPLFWATK